jgi:hypothetical protein
LEVLGDYVNIFVALLQLADWAVLSGERIEICLYEASPLLYQSQIQISIFNHTQHVASCKFSFSGSCNGA